MRFAIATVLALLIAVPAIAQPHDPLLDEVLNLGSHSLGGDLSVVVPVDVVENGNEVIGFSISFDFSDPGDSASYASDLRVTIAPPNGPSASIGGFPDPTPGPTTFLYSFQGFGSDPAGAYSSGPHYAWPEPGITKGGLWNFTLLNDWATSGVVGWNNVQLTLHKVPEPGSLALLVMGAGMLIRRRK